jgi:hypothetical protein
MIGAVPGEGIVVVRVLRLLCLLVVACLAMPLPAVAAPTASSTIYVSVLDDLSPRVAGRPTDFTASLYSGDAPVAGEVLVLWLQPVGGVEYAAGQATTGSDGSVTVWATLQHNATARWTHEATSYDASTSMPYVVQIAPRVTVRTHDRTLRRGQRLVVRGRTFPAKTGCTVTLLRGLVRPLTVGPRPVRLARATVRTDGSYRLVRRFHKKARMRVAVKVSACAGNASGLSPYLRVRVR